MVKCPHCGYGTEKIYGCNHMTCSKCRKEWCWLCRGNYNDYHFNEWNFFGCPGAQDEDITPSCNIIRKLVLMFFMPLILLFGPIIYLMVYFCEHCIKDRCCSFLGFILFFFAFIFSITFGIILGALALSLLLVPIYLV